LLLLCSVRVSVTSLCHDQRVTATAASQWHIRLHACVKEKGHFGHRLIQQHSIDYYLGSWLA